MPVVFQNRSRQGLGCRSRLRLCRWRRSSSSVLPVFPSPGFPQNHRPAFSVGAPALPESSSQVVATKSWRQRRAGWSIRTAKEMQLKNTAAMEQKMEARSSLP